jgi:thiamine pyrophosphate-dependent acetolactate synthase large subunit-like protein
MQYLKLDSEEKKDEIIRAFLEKDRPVLLEVDVDPDETA